jgi:hypothetical protein
MMLMQPRRACVCVCIDGAELAGTLLAMGQPRPWQVHVPLLLPCRILLRRCPYMAAMTCLDLAQTSD